MTLGVPPFPLGLMPAGDRESNLLAIRWRQKVTSRFPIVEGAEDPDLEETVFVVTHANRLRTEILLASEYGSLEFE